MSEPMPDHSEPVSQSDSGRSASIWAFIAAVVLSILALFPILDLSHADLHVPFAYSSGETVGSGDSFFYYMLTKSVIDNGWYLNNPCLGAPGSMHLADFPVCSAVHVVTLKTIGWFTHDFASAVNIYYLLSFPLSALAATYALRRLGLSSQSSVLAGVLFAYLPYHFFRGQAHLFLSTYYAIPLLALVVLRLASGIAVFGYDAGWRRSDGALAICALIAATDVYYAFFAVFLLLTAGAFAAASGARWRDWRLWRSVAALVGTVILVVALQLLPTLLYRWHNGPNPQAVTRRASDADLFSLRIIEMLLPISGHRLQLLATLAQRYINLSFLGDASESRFAALGVIGAAGFLFLLLVVVLRPARWSRHTILAPAASLTLASVLLATFGGFGAILAFYVSPDIRSYNRISIFIAFFALLAGGILLDHLLRRMRPLPRLGVVAVLLFVGLYDQTSPAFTPDHARLRASYESDAHFVQQIESMNLPSRMIFQLPYVAFPESQPVQQMHDYQLFRGYLHSHDLRWSYGAIRGRSDDQWYHSIAALPPDKLVENLNAEGFGGIYIDRFGFTRPADAKLEVELGQLLGISPLISDDRRLVFFPIARR